MFSKAWIYLFSVFLVFFVTSCEDSPVNSPLCTAEFVMINLKITDASGQPVNNATVHVIHANSGDTLQVCENYECLEGDMGNYTIFHDGLMEKVSFEGEPFTVNGNTEQDSFREDFVFARNKCHVYKKSGPEIIMVD